MIGRNETEIQEMLKAREKRGSSKLNNIETGCVKQMKLICIGREGGGGGNARPATDHLWVNIAAEHISCLLCVLFFCLFYLMQVS